MPLIFSYGSLQEERVQLVTFGRRLQGTSDSLVGYVQTLEKIGGPGRAAALDRTHCANVVAAPDADSVVAGTAFEITEDELLATDRYETRDNYARVEAVLKSGRRAWLYVSARTTECE